MTTDQTMGFVRQLIPFVGGIAVTLGWLTTDQVSKAATVFLKISGPIAILIGFAWSMLANSQSSIIERAAQMPGNSVEGNTIRIGNPDLAEKARKAAAENRT